MELHVKKFVNGGGSIINLAVDAKHATNKDYTAYATYDQGSIKRTGAFSIFSPVDTISFAITYFIVALFIVSLYILKLLGKREERIF